MLDNQVALVTGAGGGIGSAIAIELARAGADLSVSDIEQDRLLCTVSAIQKQHQSAFPVVADMLKEKQVHSMVESTISHFGRLDILVNCAGSIILKPFLETSLEEYRRQMELHFLAAVAATKATVPQMINQGGGRIISMSSISGTVGYSDHSAYSPAKGALIRFSEAVAQELKPHRINLNCIAPNAVDTGLFDRWQEETGIAPDRTGWIQPAEIGQLVVFLAGPSGRSITGETIILQGIYES